MIDDNFELKGLDMRCGFFVNAFRFFPLEYALESLAEYGYEGIELWAKGDHITPFDTEAEWGRIRDMIKSYGFSVYAISAHLDFVAPDAQKRKGEISKFEGVIKMAKFFDVDQVHTASGGLYEDISYAEQEKHFVEAMNHLGEQAGNEGVTIALEPEPEKWLSTPDQTIDLIENRLTKDVFKVVVDLGHAFAVDMTPSEYLLSFKDYIAMIHFDDVIKSDFPHRHMVPGDGEVDYTSVFETVKEIGYDSWLSMELNRHNQRPKEAARRAYEFMENNASLWR